MAIRISGLRIGLSNTNDGQSFALIYISAGMRSTSGSATRYAVVYSSNDGGSTYTKLLESTISIKTSGGSKTFDNLKVYKSNTAQTLTPKIELYASQSAYEGGSTPLETASDISVTASLRAAYTATANIRDSVDDSIIASRTAYEGDGERPSATITQSDLETQTGKKWDHFNLARDDSSILYDTYDKYPFPHTGLQPITTTGLTFDLYAFWQQGGPKIKVKVDGAWEEGELKAKVNGEWVDADAAYVKVNGAWMEIN